MARADLGNELRQRCWVMPGLGSVMQVSISQIRLQRDSKGGTDIGSGSTAQACRNHSKDYCESTEGQSTTGRTDVPTRSSSMCQLPRRYSRNLAISSTRPSRTISQLYTDDAGLSCAETLGDQAAVQQLHTWTAQILQQLLRSAEAENTAARVDLEKSCQELSDLQQRYGNQRARQNDSCS